MYSRFDMCILDHESLKYRKAVTIFIDRRRADHGTILVEVESPKFLQAATYNDCIRYFLSEEFPVKNSWETLFLFSNLHSLHSANGQFSSRKFLSTWYKIYWLKFVTWRETIDDPIFDIDTCFRSWKCC